MPETVDRLFEIACNAEREASEFYRTLKAMFAHHEGVAGFFDCMMLDEMDHLRGMTYLRNAMPPEKLSERAPADAMRIAHSFLKFTARDAVASVETLDDAYRLAVNLEFSELNKLHELLLETFGQDTAEAERALGGLKGHLQRVTNFPQDFGDSVIRRTIKPAVMPGETK
jgi:rubrerythrin